MNNTVENSGIIVAFHIGRGGRFNNPGHKTYEDSYSSINELFSDDHNFNMIYEDEEGKPLPEAEWKMYHVNTLILEGRDEIEAKTGRLELDGDYDTWSFKYIEDCSSDELDLIVEYSKKYSTRYDVMSWLNENNIIEEETDEEEIDE